VEEIESLHLFEGEQRVLLMDDVLLARSTAQPDPNGLRVSERTLFRYQYGNHLGSVGIELDDAARVISHEEFDPYGTSAYRRMNSAVEAPAKRYRYTGMERDEENGLDRHGVRYLAPTIARWVSTDPSGIADGLCLYEYVHCNPIRWLDDRGDWAREGAAAATAVAGEAAATELGTAVGAAALVFAPLVLAIGGIALLFRTAYTGPGEGKRRALAHARALEVERERQAQEEREREQRAREERERTGGNLVDEGLITEEEAAEYVRTGHLFLRASRSETEASMRTRLRFEKGNKFEQFVDAKLRARLRAAGGEQYLESQFDIATETSGNRRPDWAYRNPEVPGEFMWIADAKAYDDFGEIDWQQALGFIEEASRTTKKLLIFYVPSKANAIVPSDLDKAAAKAGVKIKLIEVPWEPELDPNFVRRPPDPKPTKPNVAPEQPTKP
jgi:RHS repeat-associated protein